MAAHPRASSKEEVSGASHHMNLKVSLQPVEVEARNKVVSMLAFSDEPERVLIQKCKQTFADHQNSRIDETVLFAKSLKSANVHHPSVRKYFSHPVRVATMALQLQTEPSLNSVLTSLLHNVYEVSGLEEHELRDKGYEDIVVDGIRVLTIDRKHQYDPDYLKSYYEGIESFSDELSLIKCIDKLDNLLAFSLFERTKTLSTYIDQCDDFVVPMADRLSPQFGRYIHEVVTHMRTVEWDRERKAQYDEFMREDIPTATGVG
jgi:(p)ppGpp synthase/HD superfamily hydrolase